MNQAWFDRCYGGRVERLKRAAGVPVAVAERDERLRGLHEAKDCSTRPVKEAIDPVLMNEIQMIAGAVLAAPLLYLAKAVASGAMSAASAAVDWMRKSGKAKPEAESDIRKAASAASAIKECSQGPNKGRPGPCPSGFEDPDEMRPDEFRRSGFEDPPSGFEDPPEMIPDDFKTRRTKEAASALNTMSTRGSLGIPFTVKQYGREGKWFIAYTSGALVDYVPYGSREEAMRAAKRVAAEEGVRVEEAQEYRGWKIEPIEGTQVGYSLPGSNSVAKQVGIGTARKANGFEVFYPDGGSKVFDTLRAAKAYIDNWLSESTVREAASSNWLSAAKANIGFVLGTGRANRDTEEAVFAFLGIEDDSGEAARRIRSADESTLRGILDIINRHQPGMLPAGWKVEDTHMPAQRL